MTDRTKAPPGVRVWKGHGFDLWYWMEDPCREDRSYSSAERATDAAWAAYDARPASKDFVEARRHVERLLNALQRWGSEEDGVPDDGPIGEAYDEADEWLKGQER